ncbi:MAG: hypothetical protein SGI88_01115 [Candidatus Hydrogenedentes bacterium]|nr:hypothetical protein [Candidatus Hydrogenedentota bacterium]
MLNPHIEQFAQSFIVKERQKRFLTLAETACNPRVTVKAMEKFRVYLDQGLIAELDRRYYRELSHQEDVQFQTIHGLATIPETLFPECENGTCFVISASHPLRFQEVGLLDALGATRSGDLVTGCEGTIYSCISGQLALYEPEIGYRILCRRS